MRPPVSFAVGAALALLATSAGTAAEPPRTHRKDARVAHIEGALVAIGASDPAVLQHGMEYARTLSRGGCSAGAQRLRVECMMVAMDRYCRERGEADARRCRLSLDVIVANVLADERLIPTERRYQIMRDNKDHRAAIAKELRRIQALLAVDYRLQSGGADEPAAMASSIDRYCLATADESHLPYQICVASLVWFIKGPK